MELPNIKEKLLGGWNAFIALLKKGYFALEDRYYAALDWLNQYIPVYKVIDPIDRHFPSFILFVFIIIGLVAGLLLMFLLPPSIQPYNATLVAIDVGSKDTLPGLDVFLSYLDTNASLKTDKYGEVRLKNLTGTVSVDVKVGKTKLYGGLEKTIVVSSPGPYYLALEGGGAAFKAMRAIVVKDRKTNLPIQGKTMGIEFSCSSGGISKWTKQAGTPEYEEEVPVDCGTMRADVSVPGYESQEKDLVNEKTYFLLNPEGDVGDTKGTIAVYVKSAEDDGPLSDIDIFLYDAGGTKKNVGISDAYGSYVFEVNPGRYYAGAMDSTGAYSPTESELKQVNSNGLVQIDLIMIPVADENKIKLLVKLVDSGTNEAVSDADFRLFVDNAEVRSYSSDANGFVVVRGIEEGDEFSAVITHPDYVTQIAESIEPIKETENTATVIQLVRAYSPACGNGIIELGESCDSEELNDMTCSNPFGFASGTLKCNTSTCQLDTSDCVAQPSCGNGIIDLGETCDTQGPNFDNKTCKDFDDFASGELACSSTCQISTADCTHTPVVYGDGEIGQGEVCDSDNLDGKTCSTFGLSGDGLSCVAPGYFDTSGCIGIAGVCNDNAINPGESCDGSNLANLICQNIDSFTSGTLGCTSGCNLDSSNCGYENGFCGDGAVGTGETCDVLGPNLDGKVCSDFDDFLEDTGALQCGSSCTIDTSGCVAPPTCGNGLIDPGETCDKKGPEFNNLQCSNFDDFTGGDLSCTDTCTIDTSTCTDGLEVNVGSVIISVSDESAKAVEGAEAHLYKTTSPEIDLGKKFTDEDGKTEEYENLPEGRYFATASNDSGDGQSPERDLVLNQTIELPVVLTLGESSIEVYVSDVTGAAIEDAEVTFYEASDDRQIGKTTTDSSGKAENTLKINLNPYVVVSATGYLPYTTTPITLIKDNTAKIYVRLDEITGVEDALDIEIAGVYDALLNGRAVTQLAAGKEYYFRFNVIVPANTTYSDVIAHLRTDLDSILNSSDSEMKFWIKAISATGASVIKSATFDPNDPYSNQNEVETDAKQANISFGDLDAGTYEFYARTYIKAGLANDTLIELHYSAKSAESSTSSLLEQYYIGSPFCTDCTFAYAFSLDGVSIDPNETTELLQDTDYSLEYEIYNASDDDYANVTAGFSNQQGGLAIEPTSDSLGNIDSKASVSDSVSLQGTAQIALTQLLMQLSPTVTGNSATVNFEVLAKNPMEISTSPEYLYPRIRNILSINVSDGLGHGIEGALVKLSLDSDFSSNLAEGYTESNGMTRFNIDALAESTIIYISAEKANYIAANAEVEVKDVYYPPPTADFSCLEIEDVDGDDLGNDGLPDVNIHRGWHSTFKVNSSECEEDSEITFSSELSLSEDASNCSNPTTSLSVDLQETDSKTLCVLADQYQGEYPVHVNAQFASMTESSRIAELTVYAYDDDSCFWIDKTAFDIFNAVDSGIISNKCYSYVEDDNYPYLISDADAIALALTAEPLDEEILMLENFKGMEITEDANIDFNISVTGKANVELMQADIYMQAGSPSPGKHSLSIQTSPNVWSLITAQYYLDYYPIVDANGWVENYGAPAVTSTETYTRDCLDDEESISGVSNSNLHFAFCDGDDIRISCRDVGVGNNHAAGPSEDYLTTSQRSPNNNGCWATEGSGNDGAENCEVTCEKIVIESPEELAGWQALQQICGVQTAESSTQETTSGELTCKSTQKTAVSGSYSAFLWGYPYSGAYWCNLKNIWESNNCPEGYSFEGYGGETTSDDEIVCTLTCTKTYTAACDSGCNSGDEQSSSTCATTTTTETTQMSPEEIAQAQEDCDAYAGLGADLKADKMRIEVNPEEEEIPEATTGTQLTCKSGILGYCEGDELICPEGYEPEMYSEGGSEIQALCYGADGSALYSGMCVKQYETDCSASPACSSYVDETFYSYMPSNICYLAIVGGGESCITQQEHFESYPEDSEVSSASCTLPPEAIEEPINPKLDLAKWTYIRTKPNAPEIEFDIENISLDGTQYAVITVRDYTYTSDPTNGPLPQQPDIAFNWAVSGVVNETTTETTTTCTVGDPDNDGSVTSEDEQAIWDIAAGYESAPSDICCVDVDKDASITARDALFVLNHYLGNENPADAGNTGLEEDCLVGDATQDGSIAADDAETITNYYFDGAEPTDVDLCYMDIDKDGSITATDALYVYNYVLGAAESSIGEECTSTGSTEQQVPITETGAFTIENPEAGRVYEVGAYAFEAAPEVSDWKWLLRVENDSAFVVDATDAFLMSPDGTWYQVTSTASWPYGIVTGLTTGSTTVTSSGTYENPFPMPEDTAEIAVELLGLPSSLPSCIGSGGDNCGGHINIRYPSTYEVVNYSTEEINVRFVDSGGDGRAVFFAGIKYKSYLPAEYGVSDDSDLVEVFIDPSAKKVYAKVLGVPAPTTIREEKFHIKLQSGYANLCYGRDDVPGNFGSEKVPKVKFDWDWSNIGIDFCSSGNADAVYCDATQFSVALMKRIEMIDNLMNVDNNYDGAEQYKHFSAYLIKDGYSEDFQSDFSTYFQNAFFGASSWFAEGDTGFANIFEDPARFVFTTFDSTGADPREKVAPLAAPGLYNVDIGLVYDDPDVSDFFSSGDDPNVTATVYLTLAEVPENDNPFYSLPFNGSIGMEDGVYARAGYGLGYDGEELLISQNDMESIKTATSASDNTIATEKHTDFDTVNITYAGSVLMATPDSVSLLPSDATPVLMRVKEHDGYADAFYSLRDGDARFGTNADYMASWIGIASNNDCRDFSGNVLYSNNRDYLANDITHHASLDPLDIGDSAFGFSWESAEADSELFLRTVLYAPIGNTIDLFSAYLDNPLFVSPNAQVTSTTEPIRLNYTSAVMNNGNPVISSLDDVFELAKEDKLCIASSAENIDFYWNPEFISESLKPYSDEVNEILCRD